MSNQSFASLLKALAEPFPADEVAFKPGAINRERTKALALAYVDSRVYIERLNRVVSGGWQDEYTIHNIGDRVVVVCSLTIQGVTRTGDGECPMDDPNAVTTASAQAFKRACVKFGLGAYLYHLPQVWCEYDEAKKRIVKPPTLPAWARPNNGSRPSAKAKSDAQILEELGFSPAEDTDPGFDPWSVVIHFGRNQGKTLGEVDDGWLHWAAETWQPRDDDPQGAALKAAVRQLIGA